VLSLNERVLRRKRLVKIDNRQPRGAVASLVAKAFKTQELLKIGNRSYVDAFKYPESRFDAEDLKLRPRQFERVISDPLIKPKPYSYMVFQDEDGLIYGKNWRGANEFSGEDAAAVINNALSALTPGRTWKETVVPKGGFTLNSALDIPSYTELRLMGKLTLDNNVNDSIIKATGKNDIAIIGGILDGNRNNQTAGHGVELVSCNEIVVRGTKILNVKDDGVHGLTLTKSLIEGIRAENCGGAGVWLNNGSNYTNIVNVETENTASAGIHVAGDQGETRYVSVIGCHVKSAGYNGIFIYFNVYDTIVANCEVEDVTSGWGFEIENSYLVAVIGNIVHDCTPSIGIKLLNSFSSSVIGNIIRQVGRHGILLGGSGSNLNAIVGNTIDRVGQQSDKNYDGISIGGDDGGGGTGTGEHTYNVISGNTIRVPSFYYGLRHAIREYGTSDNNIIAGNTIFDEGGMISNEPISKVGSNTIVKNNRGFTTENSGTATILSGNASVTFAHGLAGTPTLVVLGATHSEVADAVWSADATNITITVPSAVTANRDISWYAEYKP